MQTLADVEVGALILSNCLMLHFNFFVVFAKEKHMHESLFQLIGMSLQRVDIDSDTSVQLQFFVSMLPCSPINLS